MSLAVFRNTTNDMRVNRGEMCAPMTRVKTARKSSGTPE